MTDVINPPITLPGAAGVPVVHDGHTVGADGAPDDHGPSGILKWLTTTDHKVIGLSYMITSLVLFYLAGIMALGIRVQLATPSNSFVSFQQYNELFTMHGSLMLYLFAGPFAFGGLANYIVP
ncbi:MAG TPA: cbb3-type cytochrome c oxidase subunit I, partial [Acidimicrobiales bacterium]|nr:cbb3-type cytochrome c oxidase subunit I [Acidimicrobiales bacterium]